MSLTVFVFGVIAFALILDGVGAEAQLALATTALGGIVGSSQQVRRQQSR
jgi:hypothetical protein